MSRANLRRHERVPAASPVKLRWNGTSGEARFARGKILDTSSSGLSIELMEPIRQGSYVTLDALGLNKAEWVANGSVRHCRSIGSKYLVGVELKTGAKWD